MEISILCSDSKHPIHSWLQIWQETRQSMHQIEIVETSRQLSGGDLLFLISCSELIGPSIRALYCATLVIHASNVPEGRGWSPHVWQVLEGKKEIPITLLEAEDKVDSGAIWAQKVMQLDGHELSEEINEKLFSIEIQLMDFAVDNFDSVRPYPQPAIPPSYYRKRTPEDSRIDPSISIAEQFDVMRIADPERFPAFFELRGHRYRIRIDKLPPAEE